MQLSHAGVEPLLQLCALPPSVQPENAETNLAENDRVNGHFVLMAPQPRHDPRVGGGPGGLAQNIGVDEISHSVSVNSELNGNEVSLLRARQQPVDDPLIGASGTTLEFVHAFIPGAEPRIPGLHVDGIQPVAASAGNTIWPLDETLVLMAW